MTALWNLRNRCYRTWCQPSGWQWRGRHCGQWPVGWYYSEQETEILLLQLSFGKIVVPLQPMDIQDFFTSLLHVVCEMAPYLLLGFFIAGVLHVFVPQKFYATYLSRNNKLSVVWAALLGVPLPLCSCGVIPTAIGLRNEKASKGSHSLVSHCHTTDGHRLHPGHVFADGTGVRDNPSYSCTYHGCLWRTFGKPTLLL